MFEPSGVLPSTLLPAHLRVLYIAGPARAGAWLAEAFATDSACQVSLHEVVDVSVGLACLREEPFDAVLVSHEGAERDALPVLDAIRAGSSEHQPVIVLGTVREQDFADLCYESGGDAYVCVDTTTTRGLLWQIAFACQRHRLQAENQRLQNAQRHQLALEHREANRLLDQQRAMLQELESLYPQSSAPVAAVSPTAALVLPEMLVNHYRELLRAYVIMGSGNLADEMNQLAELLASAQVSPHQAMRMHLSVLEDMVHGLGSRSARHVMMRADMLILEIIINLGEEYRHRMLHRGAAVRLEQRWLPGFESAERTRSGQPWQRASKLPASPRRAVNAA